MNGPTGESVRNTQNADRSLIRREAAKPERVQQRESAGKRAGRSTRKI